MKDKKLLHRLRAAFFYWLWLPGLVIGFGQVFDHLFNLEALPPTIVQKVFATGLLGAGLFFISWADRDLAILGGGTPSPAQPTKKLVTDGSFALCRHPMHFGYSLAALAVVLFFRSPATLFLCYPLFLGWQVFFLKTEETILTRRFREEYQGYRSKVPFLIPSFFPRNNR